MAVTEKHWQLWLNSLNKRKNNIMFKIKSDFSNGATVVPTDLIDKYLKLAPSASFKVLLFILRNPNGAIDEKQISICIIFIVIYFSILSLQQVIELKRETKSIRILHYIGKSDKQVKDLVKKQIAFRLLLPMIVTFFLLAFSIPLLNLKMNLLLPITMHNILLKAAGWFGLCFLLCICSCTSISIYYIYILLYMYIYYI